MKHSFVHPVVLSDKSAGAVFRRLAFWFWFGRRRGIGGFFIVSIALDQGLKKRSFWFRTSEVNCSTYRFMLGVASADIPSVCILASYEKRNGQNAEQRIEKRNFTYSKFSFLFFRFQFRHSCSSLSRLFRDPDLIVKTPT